MGDGLPTDPTRRAGLLLPVLAVVLAAAAACAQDRPRPIVPSDDLFDPNPTRRVQAVTHVRRTGAKEHVPTLIELLDDEDEGVRMLADTALTDLTGRRTGYRPYATAEERRAHVEEWRRWWAAQAPAVPPGRPAR